MRLQFLHLQNWVQVFPTLGEIRNKYSYYERGCIILRLGETDAMVGAAAWGI